jgi:hypothetical protein
LEENSYLYSNKNYRFTLLLNLMCIKLPSLFGVVMSIANRIKNNTGTRIPHVLPVQRGIKTDWGDSITISGKNLPADENYFFDKNASLVISNIGQMIRYMEPVFNGETTWMLKPLNY